MKESTEGGHHSASVKLVEIVARRDPLWALQLIHWFHGHRVLSHEDAMVVLLKAAISVPNSPIKFASAITSFVVIPYSRSSPSELIEGLIRSLWRTGRDDVLGGANALVENAERFAFPNARRHWLDDLGRSLDSIGIQRRDIGLSEIKPNRDEEPTSSNILVMRDGTRLGEREILSRCHNASKLVGLLQEENTGEGYGEKFSHFDWRKITGVIASKLGIDEVREVSAAFRGRERESQVLVHLARRAFLLGHKDLAWSLGTEATEKSSPHGWDRMYDGGSRLSAFRCLVEIDPVKGREAAWQTFQNDFNAENHYRSRFIFSLGELAEVLCDDIPVRAIYESIEEHVHSLFPGADFPNEGPGDPNETEVDGGHGRALFELLKFHLLYPSLWVSQAACRCLGHLITTRDPTASNFTYRLLLDREAYQDIALLVLDSLSLRQVEPILQFEEIILGLANSPHWGIRKRARAISDRLGWVIPETGLSLSPLPAIYGLELPLSNREPRATVIQQEDGQRTFPDDATPFEIVYPQNIHLDAIANESSLSKESLYERTVRLMDQLGLSVLWEGGAEARLMTWLGDLGPKFTYRRPKYLAVRQAIQHLVAELYDAGRLDDRSMSRLEPILRYHDPELVLALPSPRPNFIASMGGSDQYHANWIEKIDDAFDQLATVTPDTAFIIAEETELVHPVWERFREHRMSVVRIGPIVKLPTGENIFNQQTNLLLSDYRQGGVQGLSPPIIVRNDPFGFDTPCNNWLALNPFIGRMLGWNPSPDGFFRWTNDQEEVMVESLWWVDGPVDLSAYQDVETGEGCLVIASASGWARLRKQFGYIGRVERIRRSFSEDKQEKHETRTRARDANE